MILSDLEILKNLNEGTILIEPFNQKYLGSNSYDVHLSRNLCVYEEGMLDVREPNATKDIYIPDHGLILQPGELYLGVTKEYTETPNHVPFLEGRSSIGRLGIDIHATAGKGDIGFKGNWTLEISVIRPVRIYPNIRIGQLIYFETKGEVGTPYSFKQNAKYNNRAEKPAASRYFYDRKDE